MSGSLNKVMIIGNLGKDPEVRHTQDGKAIVNLSVATTESWRDRNSGERKERTEWHRVVIFNDNIAKIAEQYLKKGSTVFVDGQLQTRKWTDKDGVDKYSTEIVLQAFNGQLVLLGGKDSDSRDSDSQDRKVAEVRQAVKQAFPDLDDAVPFAPEFR